MSEYHEWIKRADDDLNAAKEFIGRIADWIVVFHLQQAVEKYFKAYLIKHNIKFKKTHDLVYLIELCKTKDPDFSILEGYELDSLFPIGINLRYPLNYEIDKESIKDLIKYAKKVKEFVLKKI